MPLKFVVGSQSTYLNIAARQAVGTYWPDGNVCFRQVGTAFSGWGAKGASAAGSIVKTVGTYPDFAATSSTPMTITGLSGVTSYAGGGAVIQVGSDLWMSVHCERWPGGNSSLFWGFLGAAKSTDGGASWAMIGSGGPVIQTKYAFSDANTQYSDVEGGPVCVVGGYYYIFFREYPTTPASEFDGSYTSAARCPVATFETAFAAGTVPAFSKYTGGGTWAGNPLTGTGSPLTLPDASNLDIHWPEVVWHRGTQSFLIAGSYYATPRSGGGLPVHQITWSKDAVHWATPTDLMPSNDGQASPEAVGYSSVLPSRIAADRSCDGPMSFIYLRGSGGFDGSGLARRTVTPSVGPRRTRSNKFQGGPASALYR